MIAIEKIQQYLQQLPQPLQAEALDFIEYLVSKAERESVQQEAEWSNLSLTFAMRGIEDENAPAYSTADLKVVFS